MGKSRECLAGHSNGKIRSAYQDKSEIIHPATLGNELDGVVAFISRQMPSERDALLRNARTLKVCAGFDEVCVKIG